MTIEIDYTLEAIVRLTRGDWQSEKKAIPIRYLSLDSRKITYPKETLFWAIRTESGDGADHIMQAYNDGVRNFISERNFSAEVLQGANVVKVQDALGALQMLAAQHRNRFTNIHIIGITGSNGKTLVKEWLAELLEARFSVVRSPMSYNSQVGVPLSVLQIRAHHDVGIFEAGISRAGEMEKLERIIRPHTGILTNIGTAHDEGFEGRDQKVAEKLKLFSNAQKVVLPCKVKNSYTGITLQQAQMVCWDHTFGDLRILHTEKYSDHTKITVENKRGSYTFTIPFTDEAAIESSISCFGGLQESGFWFPEALNLFGSLHPVSMRLEMKAGLNRCAIINDSYNNDLQSLTVAVDFLKQQGFKKSTVIISDLLQSGLPDEELYREVAHLLEGKGIDRLIGIGDHLGAQQHQFTIAEQHFFADTEEFIKSLSKFQFSEEAILIKGARKFAFEKVTRIFELQQHKTIFSINLSHLAHNVRTYKGFLRPGTKLMAMVKAFAYGSGGDQIATFLQYVKADYLAVAFADEGARLREAGIHLPIMVLNVDESNYSNIIRYQLEPEIFSFRMLDSFLQHLKRSAINSYPIHIKIDTGMHRLGFEPSEIEQLAAALQSAPELKVESVFTHLSSSDSPAEDEFSRRQLFLFNDCANKLKEKISAPFIRHVSNTSAISRLPEFQLDMVRLGIGMYGIDESPEIKRRLKLVNQLSTTVSQIRKVRAGESVGYGRKHILREDRTVATVGIGYADGYPRALGNGNGYMQIGGQLAPTIGNVCMDMTMLDVTGIDQVQDGDKAVVFGDAPTIQQVAEWAGTIPYEILTGISPRVKRIYFTES